MEHRAIGAVLIVLGVAAVVIGILAWSGALSWFGRLPGDIRVQRENFSLYVPIVSMLVISLVLSIILWVVRRFL